MSGPTYFGEVLTAFKQYTEATVTQGNQYQVLLILTDGSIHDMEKTKELVVGMTDLPASVIIVGVGRAEFGMMHALDADEEKLRAPSGKVAKRDIVQFVEFNDAIRKGNLAEQVLAEIPN